MAGVFQEIPIEQLCSKVTTGATPLRSRSDFYEGGTTDWYKTGELKDWYLSPAEERITKKALEETSVKLFPANTVLMAMYGDGRTITSLGMLRAPAATNQACSAMLVDEEKCDTRYFFYALKGRRHLLLKVASGGAQRNLSGKLIKEFKLPVPPLPVQRRIAGILSAYDELMENSQRRIRLLEAMARALYREWFVHFRFPGHEKHPRVASPLGDIPQGWEVKQLSELFEFLGGAQPPKSEHAYDEQSGYVRFIQNRDYGSSRHLTYIKENRKNKLCDRLDIMVDKYGEPGTTRFGLAGAYNVALAKLLPHKPHHREWLRGLISEPDFNTYLVGASMAATRASLNSSHFTVDVCVPSDEVSQAFQRHVEPLLKLSLTHQDQIQNLRRTRDLLLPRLLSGQVNLETN